MRTIKTLSALFLVLMYADCGGKGSGPSASSASTASTASPASTASGDAAVSPRAISLEVGEDRFQIGKTVEADGKVLNDTDQFVAGDPIYISFVVKNAPAGAFARVIWKRIDGDVKISEEQKPLAQGGFVSFAVKSTAGWAPGKYRVEKWYGLEASGTKPPWKGLGAKDLTISPR